MSKVLVVERREGRERGLTLSVDGKWVQNLVIDESGVVSGDVLLTLLKTVLKACAVEVRHERHTVEVV